MTKTAIIAGSGVLPGLLASALSEQGHDFLLAEMDGFPANPVFGHEVIRFRVERLVPFLEQLAQSGVSQVTFAGAISRPRLEPELFDPRTATLVPRLLGAIKAGDDAALREVISIFEDWEFTVVGADHIAPDLVPKAGVLYGAPSVADQCDAARGAEIVSRLGALDLGQGAVVAQGLCLAVETLPGTDAMLEFVAKHAGRLRPDPKGAKGILYKAPKPGQDRRIDLPVIGPDTLRAVHKAGLAGVVWQAGGALLLGRDEILAEAERLELFLWSRDP